MIVSQVRLVEWEDGAAVWPEIEYEYCYVALVQGILFIITGMWVGAWTGIRG